MSSWDFVSGDLKLVTELISCMEGNQILLNSWGNSRWHLKTWKIYSSDEVHLDWRLKIFFMGVVCKLCDIDFIPRFQQNPAWKTLQMNESQIFSMLVINNPSLKWKATRAATLLIFPVDFQPNFINFPGINPVAEWSLKRRVEKRANRINFPLV